VQNDSFKGRSEKDGLKKLKVVRSTFIIDKNGIVQEALYAVRHEGHAQEILERIKAML